MRLRLDSPRVLAGCASLLLLLGGCANMGSYEQGADADGLLNAITSDRADVVEAAVKSGKVSVNHKIPAPAYAEGAPLLTIAARSGSLEVMRFLIKSGADVNARTPANETALMLAAYFYLDGPSGSPFERHEKATHMLVESGANLENERYNYTPLAYAAYQGHDHIVRYLIERGANVNADAENGITYVNTPLMMAAMQGHEKVVLRLLRAGADARVRVHGGHTARELAQKYQGQDVVGFLACAERLNPGETFSRRCEGASRAAAPGASVQTAHTSR
jgi:ankyrin repeat protein